MLLKTVTPPGPAMVRRWARGQPAVGRLDLEDRLLES